MSLTRRQVLHNSFSNVVSLAALSLPEMLQANESEGPVSAPTTFAFETPRVMPHERYIVPGETNATIFKEWVGQLTPPVPTNHRWYASFSGLTVPYPPNIDPTILVCAGAAGLSLFQARALERHRDTLTAIIDRIDALPTFPIDKQGILRMIVIERLYLDQKMVRELFAGTDPRDLLVEKYGMFVQRGTATWSYKDGTPKHIEGKFYPWQLCDALFNLYKRSEFAQNTPISNSDIFRIHRRIFAQIIHPDRHPLDLYGKRMGTTCRIRPSEAPEDQWNYLDGFDADNARYLLRNRLLLNDIFANLFYQLKKLYPDPRPIQCQPVPVGCRPRMERGIAVGKVSDINTLSYAAYNREKCAEFKLVNKDFPGIFLPIEDEQALKDLGVPRKLRDQILLYAAAGLLDPLTMLPEGDSRFDVWGKTNGPSSRETYLQYIEEVVGFARLNALAASNKFKDPLRRQLALRHTVLGLPITEESFRITNQVFRQAMNSRYTAAHNERVPVSLLLRITRWLNNDPEAATYLLNNCADYLVALSLEERYKTKPWGGYLPVIGQPYYGGVRFIGCPAPQLPPFGR